jgi:SAM-dependent methyltransferase
MRPPSKFGDAPIDTTRSLASEPAAFHRLSALEGHALWAPTYDHQPNPLLALEERELEPLLPDLRGKAVFDIACGTGRWLSKLLRRGASVGMGIDLSAEMLWQASGKVPLTGKLVRADCLALPLRPGTGDFAICSFAVGYIRDLTRMAEELARVLRAGAPVLISDFHPSGHLRGWRRAFRHASAVIEIADITRSVDEVCGVFECQGFKLQRCLEPCLGAAERVAFEEGGKIHLYQKARHAPAIFICQFELASPERRTED